MDPTLPAPLLVLGRRYVLERRVGAGASGRVYRCYDRLLARTVAVKLLTCDDADGLRRHRSEVATLSRLSHPGLVPLLDVGLEPGPDGGPGTPYCVMEYVDGPSLARRLQDGPLTAAEVQRAAVTLAAALAHVHACGVVHRDLKPSNILVGPDGSPRLTDFGVARCDDGSAGLTATGSVVGTPRYMAPEQVRGEPVTPASDVYALGLVLLECVTGRPEYPGPAIESAVARLFRPPQVPDRLAEPLRSLLAAMTAADPADRPDAAEVHRMLTEPVTERLRAVTSAALLLPFRFEPQPAPPTGAGRYRGLLLAGAAAALLAGGSLAVAATGHGATPPAAAAVVEPSAGRSGDPGAVPRTAADGTTTDRTATASGGGTGTGPRPGGVPSAAPARQVSVRADQAGPGRDHGREGGDRGGRGKKGKDRGKGHGGPGD